MQHLLRLCLWQAIIIGILSAHFPVNAEEERGIRMRGPKSSDVFPYDKYEGIKIHDWEAWEDPFRMTMDSYWKYQGEKDKKLYAIIDAFAQNNGQKNRRRNV